MVTKLYPFLPIKGDYSTITARNDGQKVGYNIHSVNHQLAYKYSCQAESQAAPDCCLLNKGDNGT